MKNKISIDVDSKILDEIKRYFPNANESQIVEEALLLWIKEKKKNKLKKEAKKLASSHADSLEIEKEALEDGLT